MRALLAIAGRELRERWTLPLALFVAGFVPLFLVPYLDIEVRSLAGIAAVPTSWGVALLMGGSVIARDLAEGRLSFFFARPVPWWSIAGGKLLAALLMSVAAPIAAVLPGMVFDWNPARDAEGLGELLSGGQLAVLLALLVALVAFGHVANVVYRARSTWSAVDFVLLACCVWAGVWLFYAFKRLGVVLSGAPQSLWAMLLPLLLVAAVPFTATLVQVAVGRSDLQRGHRALSLTFWSGVLLWFAVLSGFLARERAVTPAALGGRGISGASPDGRLVGIFGSPGPRREAAFVYDTASRRSLRLGLGSHPAFSADGQHVAWVEEAPFWRQHRPTAIQLARLSASEVEVEPVELTSSFPADAIVELALSPQADKLAIVQLRTLSVFELPSGRALSTTSASDGDWMTAAFLPDGQLRAFRRVRPAVGPPGAGIVPGRVEVVSMGGGVPESAIRLEAVGHAILRSPPEEDQVLLDELGRYSLHDARSGRRVVAFDGRDGLQVRDAFLLSNGRIAVTEAEGQQVRLRLAGEGRPDIVAALPAGPTAWINELPGGLVAVGSFTPKPGGRLVSETFFFSSDTAEPRGREAGVLPALRLRSRLAQRVAGTAAQLFVSDAGELLQLDPASHERRVLLPAPPAQR